MILAKNRESKVNIYVKENFFDNTDSPVWNAAYYLRYYLSRITVAPFEIEAGGKGEGIYIDLDTDYTDDEFSIKTENESLYIKGGKRGVLYGVYEFLEDLGCRFFTPDCEKIPTIVNLEIPSIDKREKPVFEYRETDYPTTTKKECLKFATMCRVNGSNNHLPESLGGNLEYALFIHTLPWLVPPEEHFAEHPEYYALYNGERIAGEHLNWQLCLSNPDIVPIAVDNIRKILKANPDKKIVSISQNDNLNHCQCEACQKINEEEGSPVGALIRFANKIAEILEPEFPDVLFDILAYNYTRPASHLTPVRHNTCIRLCASLTCYAHPYDKCDDRSHAQVRTDGERTLFIEDLEEWSKICNRIYIWDYTTNYPICLKPFPNWRVLQPNMQVLAKYNVKGVFEQANRARDGSTDFNELRNYLLCKLMWNPDCDIERHRKEFMEYYYGEAATYLDEYLNMLSDFVERENYHMYIQEIHRPDYLTNELLEKYNALFDKAEAAVSGDGIRLARVQKARLSIRFADVYWNEIIDKGFDTEKINQFFTDLRAHNISRLDEWCNLEGTYYGWVQGWNRGVYVHEPFRFQPESLL